jgi:signal transduction histidine kinase
MRESSTIEFRETIDPIDSSLSPEDSIQLFRIIQEAMNNILKHSGATLATVSVRQNGQAIDVVVSDNGKGFIAHSAAKDDDKPATFGLGGIEQRVGMMNGTWSIQSSPGSGTTVNIRIPVKGQPQ